MSELEILAMFFIQIIVGLGILVLINAIIYCIGIVLIVASIVIYALLIDPVINFCKSLFWKVEEFFFPAQKLPEWAYEMILREAAEFVHSKHRPWGNDNLFGEYIWVASERLCIEWDKAFGDEI